MYIYILYCVIVIIVILFFYSLWERKKIYREVDRLDDWKLEISSRPITNEIGKIKGLKMSGETEKKFEKWRQCWDEIVGVKLPDLEEDLFDVEEYANKYRFKKAKQLISEVENKLAEIDKDLQQLLAEVDELVNSEEKNREEISEIRKKYYELRKNFSVHRGSFGKSALIIEERFERLYKQFPDFDKATEDGNYLEARTILETIKEELEQLDQLMKEVPKLLVQLESHIPGDLKNLLQGLEEMKNDGYAMEHFSIADNIQQLEEERQEALNKLHMLEIADVQARVKEINASIDDIYDALETEVKSRAYVLKMIQTIKQRITATKERLDELFAETEYVQRSYHVTEEELRHHQHLAKQLKDLTQRLSAIDTIVEQKKQSYTSIHEMLVDFSKEYDELEKNIEAAEKKLADLRHDELKAKETLKQLKGKLLRAKRDVQKSNIPGLPDSVLKQMMQAEKALQDASETLTQVPLDMKAVTSKAEEAVAHVESVVEKTKETIEKAETAELIIQYGNRYRSYSEEINELLNEAEQAFRSFYYDEAIDIAQSAIEPFEPNVMEKIKQFV